MSARFVFAVDWIGGEYKRRLIFLLFYGDEVVMLSFYRGSQELSFKLLMFVTAIVFGVGEGFAVEKQVYQFGPGVFELDEIVISKNHALIEGAGRGVTILKVKNGIRIDGVEPVLRDFTIVGTGEGTGISLYNTWTANLENIEIENYELGVHLELNENGRWRAGGKTLRGWPGALTEGHWGSRVSLTEIRSVEIIGSGNGVLLTNELPLGNEGLHGEFFTATNITDGHIKVKGHALIIKGQVWGTHLIGTYIDIGDKHGIVMDENARTLKLIGVSLDLPKRKREMKGNEKIVMFDKSLKHSVLYYATNVTKDEIVVLPIEDRSKYF